MSYLQDRKKKQKRYTQLLVTAVVFAACMTVSVVFFDFFSRISHTVFSPVLAMTNRMSMNIKNTKAFFISKTSLLLENQELKQQLLAIDARLANYEAVFNENEKIKEILLRKPGEKKMLLAGILGTQNKSLYDSLIIDAGSLQGLEVGQRVFAYGDVPIGTITDVFPESAKVALYSTSGQKMSAVLSGSDTFIELMGRGRGNFEVILPRDFDIVEGTLVLLPGLEPYALAEVVTVISDPRDPFKKALLKSPINILELKFVQVEI